MSVLNHPADRSRSRLRPYPAAGGHAASGDRRQSARRGGHRHVRDVRAGGLGRTRSASPIFSNAPGATQRPKRRNERRSIRLSRDDRPSKQVEYSRRCRPRSNRTSACDTAHPPRRPLGRFRSRACWKAIHRHLFQDIYDWAGDIRTVEISKGGSQFQFRQYIETGMADVHRRIEAAEIYSRG